MLTHIVVSFVGHSSATQMIILFLLWCQQEMRHLEEPGKVWEPLICASESMNADELYKSTKPGDVFQAKPND